MTRKTLIHANRPVTLVSSVTVADPKLSGHCRPVVLIPSLFILFYFSFYCFKVLYEDRTSHHLHFVCVSIGLVF